MITDSKTNVIYLADCLPQKQPKFFRRFKKLLDKINVGYKFLPNTKDIWCVDYMPIQIDKSKFIRFTYKPDYLKPKKYNNTISDVDNICRIIKLKTRKSELIVDGGNITKTTDKVIMTDKVFLENKHIPKNKLINRLKSVLEVDKLYFVPWDKNDFLGHVDGMVRFINDDTILINDYSSEDVSFQREFKAATKLTGLNWIELPYVPNQDINSISAKGVYMNFLQMDNVIIMPIFKNRYDEKAFSVLEQVFKSQNIITLNSIELAEQGGLLNCITWNIFHP